MMRLQAKASGSKLPHSTASEWSTMSCTGTTGLTLAGSPRPGQWRRAGPAGQPVRSSPPSQIHRHGVQSVQAVTTAFHVPSRSLASHRTCMKTRAAFHPMVSGEGWPLADAAGAPHQQRPERSRCDIDSWRLILIPLTRTKPTPRPVPPPPARPAAPPRPLGVAGGRWLRTAATHCAVRGANA